jgi:hypothetical protein
LLDTKVTRPEERTNIGPDHKLIDMKAFYATLAQALRDAHLLGQRTRKLLPNRAD